MSILPRAALALAVFIFAVAGCSSETPENLPAADSLLASAADAMSSVKTIRFTVDVAGNLKYSPLRHAEGVVSSDGSAEGAAKRVDQSDVRFVIVDDLLYTSFSGGPYQKMPLQFAASVYDPRTLLDPERGIAKLLRTARNSQTDGYDKVGGRDTYLIEFEPTTMALAALIPGTGQVGASRVWIDDDTKRIVRAEFNYPSTGITTNIFIYDYDVPVTIVAPS